MGQVSAIAQDVAPPLDWPAEIFSVMRAADVRQVAYVPDAGHGRLIDLCHAENAMTVSVLTTEEEGVALMAGAVDTGVVSALTRKPPKAPLTGVRLAGRQVSFSSEKAAAELGWRAAPAEPALAAMLEWAREKGLLKAV